MYIKIAKVLSISILLVTSNANSEEPLSIVEMAKRNAIQKNTGEVKKKVEEEKPLDEKTPYLIKVIKPYSGSNVASIYFDGGIASYRVGDFVPPYYKLTEINHNSVNISCSRDKKCPLTKLSLTGVEVD